MVFLGNPLFEYFRRSKQIEKSEIASKITLGKHTKLPEI